MTTIRTSTGGYSTAGYAHMRPAEATFVDVARDLCGDLSPAEVRVVADLAVDPEATQGDALAVLAGILADHRDVDVEDVEQEVQDFLDNYEQ